MTKKQMAVLLVTVGVIVYFFPQLSDITQDKNQLTGAIFAVGGAILWYLPTGESKKTKKSR